MLLTDVADHRCLREKYVKTCFCNGPTDFTDNFFSKSFRLQAAAAAVLTMTLEIFRNPLFNPICNIRTI